jgi:hypothetical protein
VKTIRHPLSGATYDLTAEGEIEVAKDGETGRFTQHGVWLRGAIRHADPHLCLWIAGRDLSRPRPAAETETVTAVTSAASSERSAS